MGYTKEPNSANKGGRGAEDKFKFAVAMLITFGTILFFGLLLLTSVAFGQYGETQTMNFDLNTREDLPVVLHQEMKINGDTVEVRNFYTLRESLENFTCGQIISSSGDSGVWDYEVYLNNSLIHKKWYVETIEENSLYVTTLPCMRVNTPAEILQQYNIKGIVKNIVNEGLYPFDDYSINLSWEIGDYPELYSLKVIIPRNTYPIGNINFSYISGPFQQEKELRLKIINGTTGQETDERFGKIVFLATKIRPAITSHDDQYYYFIFRQLGLPSKNEIIQNRTAVKAVISWERPPLIKFLWIISLVSISILTFLFMFKNYKICDYITYCFGIWIFQEGLSQLIPSVRPLTVTLFESTIIIPLSIVISRSIFQYIKYKRKKEIIDY